MKQILFVGAGSGGVGANGKVSVKRYLEFFRWRARQRGVGVTIYPRAAEYVANAGGHLGATVILMYNEERAQALAEAMRVAAVERVARENGCEVVHPLATGLQIGRKCDTSLAFTAWGVPTPPLITDPSAPTPVFSHGLSGSSTPVTVHPSGAALPDRAHNTEYLNAQHCFGGRWYTVCLRALCVGTRVIAVYVRTAQAPKISVHARDTDRDPKMIWHFHRTLVEPAMGEIEGICRRIGQAMGLVFFAHDIVPSGGRLYVCETGIKFDDMSYRSRLKEVYAQMPVQAIWDGRLERESADAFLDARFPEL